MVYIGKTQDRPQTKSKKRFSVKGRELKNNSHIICSAIYPPQWLNDPK